MAAEKDRLSRLEAQKQKLAEQAREVERKIQAIRARQQAAERKKDTRRKVLVGAMFLEKVERGEYAKQTLLDALDKFLIRDEERALFDLPPRKENSYEQLI